jgi:hypothetical protein
VATLEAAGVTARSRVRGDVGYFALRHEALVFRMGVKDRHLPAVVAVG